MTISFSKTEQLSGPIAAKPALQPGRSEFALVVFVLFIGLSYAWTRRNEGDWTAESGFGYWLGIGGATMMLVLLIYPLRKRIRALHFLGDIPGWFRIHMILGVAGPALVIAHSNFSLGSTNSRAAMISMLVVAGSGFVGRFLYSRIHRGLYGQQQSVQDELNRVEALRNKIAVAENNDTTTSKSALLQTLTHYQACRLNSKTGFALAFWQVMSGPVSRARLRRKLLVDFREKAAQDRANSQSEGNFLAALDKYFNALGRAEAFAFYERAFAYWHLLHLPLFFIMILATIAHIIAVHLY